MYVIHDHSCEQYLYAIVDEIQLRTDYPWKALQWDTRKNVERVCDKIGASYKCISDIGTGQRPLEYPNGCNEPEFAYPQLGKRGHISPEDSIAVLSGIKCSQSP